MNIEDLSNRELQVWKGIVEGKSMREMAEDMGIMVSAVWFAVARLDYKLGISDELETDRDRRLVEIAQQYLTK